MMDMKSFTNWGARGAGRGRYPFRKMRKSQEQHPYKNQILHNFNLICFISMMDIKHFKYGGGHGCWQREGRRHYPFRKIRKSQE